MSCFYENGCCIAYYRTNKLERLAFGIKRLRLLNRTKCTAKRDYMQHFAAITCTTSPIDLTMFFGQIKTNYANSWTGNLNIDKLTKRCYDVVPNNIHTHLQLSTQCFAISFYQSSFELFNMLVCERTSGLNKCLGSKPLVKSFHLQFIRYRKYLLLRQKWVNSIDLATNLKHLNKAYSLQSHKNAEKKNLVKKHRQWASTRMS